MYLACLMPVFVYEIFYVIVCPRSVKREIELLRQAMKNTTAKNNTADEENKSFLSKINDFVNNNEKSLVLGVRIALIGCAVGFIVAGIINGGMNDVLKKAVKICTECIGLG